MTEAESLFKQGEEIINQGRYEEAEQYFRKVIEIQPDHAEAWNSLAITLLKQDRYDEAEQAFRKIIELRPEFTEVLMKEIQRIADRKPK
ncbi:MAG: tetratricopeptide repeat protein [Candidatus Thorarchaeota archaeon]